MKQRGIVIIRVFGLEFVKTIEKDLRRHITVPKVPKFSLRVDGVSGLVITHRTFNGKRDKERVIERTRRSKMKEQNETNPLVSPQSGIK